MEGILKREQKKTAEEFALFLTTLNTEEQKSFGDFIQGFKFATQLYKGVERG